MRTLCTDCDFVLLASECGAISQTNSFVAMGKATKQYCGKKDILFCSRERKEQSRKEYVRKEYNKGMFV